MTLRRTIKRRETRARQKARLALPRGRTFDSVALNAIAMAAIQEFKTRLVFASLVNREYDRS